MPEILVLKERSPGERRVAATPETVRKMVKQGLEVTVEAHAGDGAFFADRLYQEAGARVAPDVAEPWRRADVVLTVAPPSDGAPPVDELAQGAILIGLLAPHRHLDFVRRLADRGVTSLAMELVPRVTRAQPMDALSSQASIAGYKAVLLAATRLGRYMPLLMTAAGTIPPSRVVVMGGGVAGLQALATAKRLGAVVEVSDIRPAVKEQVESLGGRFIDLPLAESGEGAGGYAREMGEDFLRRQREIIRERLAAANTAITTALVPGRPAPRLLTREMVEAMPAGSVVVDIAAAEGGNCELTRPDEEVRHGEVLILGPTNLPASLPQDASTLYARNVHSLLSHLLHDGAPTIDPEDEILAETLLTYGGEIRHRPTAELLAVQEA